MLLHARSCDGLQLARPPFVDALCGGKGVRVGEGSCPSYQTAVDDDQKMYTDSEVRHIDGARGA